MADVSELAALIVAVAAATTVVWKMIRGLWRLARNVEDTLESANETKHLVKYHLGPNGQTRPIHERLGTVEEGLSALKRVHKIEDGEGAGA